MRGLSKFSRRHSHSTGTQAIFFFFQAIHEFHKSLHINEISNDPSYPFSFPIIHFELTLNYLVAMMTVLTSPSVSACFITLINAVPIKNKLFVIAKI